MNKNKKVKCKYCGDEMDEINLQDHKKECSKNPNLKGIDGWLILPIIGFILSALIFGYYTISFIPLLIEGDSLIFIMFILYASMTFFLIFSLVLLFQKKKEFARWAIFTLWYSFGFVVIITLIFPEEGKNIIFEILKGLIAPIIWTAYFKKSKRVKNTFIK